MKINDMFKNTKGEVVTVIEVDETRKTCMIQFEDGKTKSLSFSTLKDKRRWIQVEAPMSDEEWEQSARVELTEDEEAYIENDKQVVEEIAEQAAEKSKKISKKNLIKYNGKALTLHGWAKELNIPFGTLYARVNRFHWTYEEAFTGKRNKEEKA